MILNLTKVMKGSGKGIYGKPAVKETLENVRPQLYGAEEVMPDELE